MEPRLVSTNGAHSSADGGDRNGNRNGAGRPHPASGADLHHLSVLSVHHASASLEILEDLSLTRESAARICESIRSEGVEVLALTTCNRTEFYWCGEAKLDATVVRSAWLAHLDAAGVVPSTLVHLTGEEAARHLFRVAAGLESQLVGETEILGQVREALERGCAARSVGSFLSSLFHAALRAGGCARAETGIGAGALSTASAAVRLLATQYPQALHGNLLVIGAGSMGRAAARQLASEGARQLVVANRTPARAQEFAGELGATVVGLDSLAEALAAADAALVATRNDAPLVTVPLLAQAVTARPERPLYVFDLSLPRAVDPAARAVTGVVLHDMSRMTEIVRENRERREREIPAVEAVLERELRVFMVWARRHVARPLIVDVRRHVEDSCRAEIVNALAGADVEGVVLDRLTRRLTDRLLSSLTGAIERGEVPLDRQHTDYLSRLFGIVKDEQEEEEVG